MFTNILIGVDGGDGGRDALALARELAEPDAALALGFVWERGAGVTAAIIGAQHPATTGQETLQAARQAADIDAALAVRDASSTAAGLHEIAEELGCDLIVIGTSERQQPGRVSMTSSARASLHGAPCAVAVAPRGHAARGRAIASVGVGYEETPLGTATLHSAHQLARRLGAELRVMQVVPPLPSAWMGAPFAYVAVLTDEAGEQVRKAKERLDALGEPTADVCAGQPAARLRELSEEVDLLVLGSRSYGPLRRMLLGSTSDALVQDASCPVLVLVRAEPEPEELDRIAARTATGG